MDNKTNGQQYVERHVERFLQRLGWKLAFVFPLACLAGCPGEGSTSADMAMSAVDQKGGDLSMAPASCCGDPGDKGNSIGVGKYCTKLEDCTDPMNPKFKATICVAVFRPERKTYICSTTCDPNPDMGATCGENAQCVCEAPGLCGCTPTPCITNPRPGCML